MVLSSTWLLGADQATKAKKAKKPAPAASSQLQQLQDQLNQQQQQINQLQQQLQQSNQQLQTALGKDSSDQKARADAAAALQAASAAQQTANSLNSSVVDLKTSTTTLNQSMTLVQKDVKELLNPLAIRFKGVTITPFGWADVGAAWRQHNTNADTSTPMGNIPLTGNVNSGLSELRMSARNSRVAFRFEGKPSDNVKMTGQFMGDFQGVADPSTNPGQTNSFLFRIREAWMMAQTKGGMALAAGQFYSLWTPGRKGVLPGGEMIPGTYEGNEIIGFPYQRGAQFRVAKTFGKNMSFAFELDEPELSAVSSAYTPSALLGFEGQANSFPGGSNMPVPCCSQTFLVYPVAPSPAAAQNTGVTQAATVATPINSLQSINAGLAANIAPDLIAKIAWDNPRGAHFEVRGITRFFRSGEALNYNGAPVNSAISGQTTITNTSTMIANPTVNTGASFSGKIDTNTAIAWGFGISAVVPATKKVDFVLTADAGAGVGSRYNPGGTNNTGDATIKVSSDGTYVLQPVKSAAVAAGFELHPTPKLDVFIYAGNEYYQRVNYTDTTSAGFSGLNGSLTAGTVNKCGTNHVQTCLGYGNQYITSATSQTSANRDLWEGTVGYTYRFFRGAFGTFQTMGEYQYIHRAVWQTNNATDQLKGQIQIVDVALRYVLP
jgi:hypothetical protein